MMAHARLAGDTTCTAVSWDRFTRYQNHCWETSTV